MIPTFHLNKADDYLDTSDSFTDTDESPKDWMKMIGAKCACCIVPSSTGDLSVETDPDSTLKDVEDLPLDSSNVSVWDWAEKDPSRESSKEPGETVADDHLDTSYGFTDTSDGDTDESPKDWERMIGACACCIVSSSTGTLSVETDPDSTLRDVEDLPLES